jgi:hypothetical protein
VIIRTVDVSLMPPDAQPIADCAATEYLEAELMKVSLEDAGQVCRAVNYATALHGELNLREMQMVCAVVAILRVKGK